MTKGYQIHYIISDIKAAYSNLGVQNIDQLVPLYDPEVIFVDPVNTIKGRAQMLEHFHTSYSDVLSCHFIFNNEVQIISYDQAFLSWTMIYQHKKLKSKQPIMVNGSTFLKIGKTVQYHRDWFDLGQMVYENIPILGKLIGTVKSRLQADTA